MTSWVNSICPTAVLSVNNTGSKETPCTVDKDIYIYIYMYVYIYNSFKADGLNLFEPFWDVSVES